MRELFCVLLFLVWLQGQILISGTYQQLSRYNLQYFIRVFHELSTRGYVFMYFLQVLSSSILRQIYLKTKFIKVLVDR